MLGLQGPDGAQCGGPGAAATESRLGSIILAFLPSIHPSIHPTDAYSPSARSQALWIRPRTREGSHKAPCLVEGGRHLMTIAYQGIVAHLFKHTHGTVVIFH